MVYARAALTSPQTHSTMVSLSCMTWMSAHGAATMDTQRTLCHQLVKFALQKQMYLFALHVQQESMHTLLGCMNAFLVLLECTPLLQEQLMYQFALHVQQEHMLPQKDPLHVLSVQSICMLQHRDQLYVLLVLLVIIQTRRDLLYAITVQQDSLLT